MGRRGRVRKFGTDNGFEDQGGYMAAKKAKLEEQFEKEAQAEGEREGIFRYVGIYFLFTSLYYQGQNSIYKQSLRTEMWVEVK